MTLFVAARNDMVTMQNYTYRDREESLNASVGNFELRVCERCGFAFNSQFDPVLLSYDENYDNSVPSKIFLEYYETIARFLYKEYSLEGAFVVDVGCGKGTFLKTLCSLYPGIKGLGIDPSYESSETVGTQDNLSFVQEVFDKTYLKQKPDLIICRHVLEHMSDPVSFLRSISDPLQDHGEIPFFIEVPDLEWIIENNAFWDLCYEHCNYFTVESLGNTLRFAGFDPGDFSKAFGGQYLWMSGQIRAGRDDVVSSIFSRRLSDYAKHDTDSITKTAKWLRELKSEGNIVIVWGMATKGVVFSNLIDPYSDLIDYCVDINSNKNGCFVPHTAHMIHLPEALANISRKNAVIVVVMNPNYSAEIRAELLRFDLRPKFIDAAGNEL
ncbi:class I SAM-dependent methyltransferase [soil metagenome]